MPTYFDPIELEDIDINDNTVSFYLISLPGNAGFKFCATTRNLNDPQFKFDPETKINQYWPISRDQLRHADFAILFPEDHSDRERKQKMRTAPFKTLVDLNQAFNFNPPFNPNTPKMTFGPNIQQARQNITWQTNPSVGDNNVWGEAEANEYRNAVDNRIRELGLEVGMTPEQIETIINLYPNIIIDVENDIVHYRLFELLNSGLFPFNLLVQVDSYHLPAIVNNQTVHEMVENQLPLENVVNIYQQARNAGINDLATFWIIKNPQSIKYLLDGTLTIQDFVAQAQVAQHGSAPDLNRPNDWKRGILMYPQCILATKAGIVTTQELMNIDDVHLNMIINSPTTMNAILEERTTLENLSNLSMEELQHAVQADEYPGHGVGVR